MKNLNIIELKKSLGASLVEWTLNSCTEFIYAEKDNKELIDIAKKRGIIIPSQDLAVFKTLYCEIGTPNGNGVVVTKEGAEEGLKSAAGQQVNLNHEGFHQICGHILDATIEGNFVVIYCVLFKSAMCEDFNTITEMFEDGELFVSFELHTMDVEGNFVAERRDDGFIYVTKMLVSGCGLLVKTTAKGKAPAPACPKARVVELVASKKMKEEVLALNASNALELKLADEIIYAEQFMPDQKCGSCGKCQTKKNARIKTKTIESEYTECPYCEQEIAEKELYFDGAKWFHRPCQDKGEIILPSNKIDEKEESKVNELKKEEKIKQLQDKIAAMEAEILTATDEDKKKEIELELEKCKAELVAEQPIQLVSLVKETREEKVVTVYIPKADGSGNEETRKGYRTTVREYSDGTSSTNSEEFDIVDTYTQAQLNEKVATVKSEIEATIPVKVKEVVDVVIAERDSKEVEIKTANEVVLKVKEDEIVALKAEKDGIIANKDVEIASLKSENSNIKAELELKKFTAEDIKKAKDDTSKIVARRILLADVNDQISEADLLDDKEFEIRKLKKENDELKANKNDSPDFVVGGRRNNENGEILATIVKKYNSQKS